MVSMIDSELSGFDNREFDAGIAKYLLPLFCDSVVHDDVIDVRQRAF